MDVRAAKAQLRQECKVRRDALTVTQREIEAKKVLPRILSHPAWHKSTKVCLYASFAGELPTPGLIQNALQSGKKVYLPRVNGDQLATIHQIDDVQQLVLSPLGILEPKETAPRIDPKKIDFFLVPGIAFDKQGNRLGHGSGFYDRLLAHAKSDVFCLGYAYDFQVVPQIPVEAHDRRVDAIATPSGIIER